MAVWTDEELRREEVRGVFVIGVLALLFGFYQTQAVKALFSSTSQVGGLALNTVTALLVTFWGLYIVLTAMSMLSWNVTGTIRVVLRTTKGVAHTMFIIGIVETVVILAFLGPIVLYQSFSTNPEYFELYVGAGTAIIVGSYVISKGTGWRRKHKGHE